MNNLKWLQKFYNGKCDGEWEHTYGVRIETIDNPGWSVQIDLNYTKFEHRIFKLVDIERNDLDWMVCKVEEGKFIGVGGANNLTEIINTFREWVESIE